MEGIIDNTKVASLLEGYYDKLAVTGYVSDGTLDRYMIYLFIVSFVNSVYDFITDEDYSKIDKLLSCIFTGGGCLFPYNHHMRSGSHFTGVNVMSVKIGAPRWMRSYMNIRVTEEDEDRSTENNELRTV